MVFVRLKPKGKWTIGVRFSRLFRLPTEVGLEFQQATFQGFLFGFKDIALLDLLAVDRVHNFVTELAIGGKDANYPEELPPLVQQPRLPIGTWFDLGVSDGKP